MRAIPFAAVILSLAVGCGKAEHPQAGRDAPRAMEQAASQEAPRKIIYNASIDLLVDNLTDATEKLDKLVKDHHGLAAQSEVNTNPRLPRSGTWRLRIPVDNFPSFLKHVAKLGEPLRDKVDSQDITEKYVDYQVRIDNKKIQVERLQKIIKEQTGKISDLLQAERELGRVTTELEELKGAVKLWDNQVALATVEVVMSERRQYVPPESPSFAASVSSTFRDSVESLVAFLRAATLVVVALVPWSPVIALVVGGIWLFLRRAARRANLGGAGAKTAV